MRQSLIYGLEPWKASGCIRFAKSNRINFNQSSRYKEGAFSSLALVLCGIITSLMAPFLFPLILAVVG
ncbi:InsL [Klebsiella pneumoniae]|nr:InsL [Klebsiella pneumoniae]